MKRVQRPGLDATRSATIARNGASTIVMRMTESAIWPKVSGNSAEDRLTFKRTRENSPTCPRNSPTARAIRHGIPNNATTPAVMAVLPATTAMAATDTTPRCPTRNAGSNSMPMDTKKRLLKVSRKRQNVRQHLMAVLGSRYHNPRDKCPQRRAQSGTRGQISCSQHDGDDRQNKYVTAARVNCCGDNPGRNKPGGSKDDHDRD